MFPRLQLINSYIHFTLPASWTPQISSAQMVSKENGLELKRILPAENAIGNFPRWTVLCFTLHFSASRWSLVLPTIQSVTNLVGPRSNPWFPFSVDHSNFFLYQTTILVSNKHCRDTHVFSVILICRQSPENLWRHFSDSLPASLQ